MEPIAIVTDSTADLPAELVDQYCIHVVPNILVIQGKSVEDGNAFSREEFYTALPGMDPLPTTSTASAGTYEQLYARLVEAGFRQILSIHASSKLSGIFNAACLAAQAFSGRVTVVDSLNVSMGLGFQVLAAAEAALAHPVDGILTILEDVRRRIRVVAMLDTMEYLRRSGRVSWAKARLGELLRIKPFVEIRAGQVLRLGETRTRHSGIQRLLDMLRGLGRLERLAVLHSNAEAEARGMLEALAPDLAAPPLLVNITTVIGTHTGPNGLGFAAVVR